MAGISVQFRGGISRAISMGMTNNDTFKTTEPDENAYDVQCPECKHELSRCTCEQEEIAMDSSIGLLDIATLLALNVQGKPLSRIALDSLDGWRQAAECFLEADNITVSERVAARVLAMDFLSACLKGV